MRSTMSSNAKQLPCVAKGKDLKDYLNMPTVVMRYGKLVDIKTNNEHRFNRK